MHSRHAIVFRPEGSDLGVGRKTMFGSGGLNIARQHRFRLGLRRDSVDELENGSVAFGEFSVHEVSGDF